MLFHSLAPKQQIIKKFVQYILFNHCTQSDYTGTYTSFPNNNISLCIINGHQLFQEKGVNYFKPDPGIHAYLTGFYQKPNTFRVEGTLDEICIEFTPAGFYRFFDFPVEPFLLKDEILQEALGHDASSFFEQVFLERDLLKRKERIEHFLLARIRPNPSLLEAITGSIDAFDFNRVKEISSYFNCSEKKLYRTFKSSFGISPKEYLRIHRFRKGLARLHTYKFEKLTEIAFEAGYFDQSHFIREFKSFTDTNPKNLRAAIQDVDGKVLISVD